MNTMDIIDSRIDPWEILGVSGDAGDREIEEAWRKRSAGGGNRDKIHQAYKMICGERERAMYRLLSPGTPENLKDIKDGMPLRSRYSGPGVWYSALKREVERTLTDRDGNPE